MPQNRRLYVFFFICAFVTPFTRRRQVLAIPFSLNIRTRAHPDDARAGSLFYRNTQNSKYLPIGIDS